MRQLIYKTVDLTLLQTSPSPCSKDWFLSSIYIDSARDTSSLDLSKINIQQWYREQ